MWNDNKQIWFTCNLKSVLLSQVKMFECHCIYFQFFISSVCTINSVPGVYPGFWWLLCGRFMEELFISGSESVVLYFLNQQFIVKIMPRFTSDIISHFQTIFGFIRLSSRFWRIFENFKHFSNKNFYFLLLNCRVGT